MVVPQSRPLEEVLVCPKCQGALAEQNANLFCRQCRRVFRRTDDGYFHFTVQTDLDSFETTTEEYAEDQQRHWRRFYPEFLKPFILKEPAERVLEVGCGLGCGVSLLLKDGFEAYGVDIPCLSRYWKRLANDPGHFLFADGAQMPFPDNYFDVVYTLGVIEHIGTTTGHYTLAENSRQVREAFAKDLVRVTKPGGRVLVTCPNKTFPIDIHHEPIDDKTPVNVASMVKKTVHAKTGLGFHRVWGHYYLLSHRDARRLFCETCGAREFEPLPLRNYFAFSRLQTGLISPIKNVAISWINDMPKWARETCLSPWMIAQIRK